MKDKATQTTKLRSTIYIIHPTLNPKTGPSLSNGLSEAGIGFIPTNSIKDNEETVDSLRPLLNKNPTDAKKCAKVYSSFTL